MVVMQILLPSKLQENKIYRKRDFSAAQVCRAIPFLTNIPEASGSNPDFPDRVEFFAIIRSKYYLVFWDVTPCSLATKLHGVRCQKTVNLISKKTSKNCKFNLIILVPCSENKFLRNMTLCVNGPASLGAERCNPVTACPEPGG
jgi:hypothetical protein